VTVPWGPKFDQVEQIVNQVKNKDKVAFFSAIQKRKYNPNQKLNYNPIYIGTIDGKTWKRVLDGREMDKPIEWIKETNVYQDIENGRKNLMTGSFYPVVENWEEDVYTEDRKRTNQSIKLSRNTDYNNYEISLEDTGDKKRRTKTEKKIFTEIEDYKT